ncbi:unnamed protein product [Arctia plantaginis]|uniref:Uncharacterized protein n=1 Tax=Arctia plantaginis TaxID=874455 RepID=A0A8S1AWG5_ARCPL|nr:unnamed protein product [Arctia plantaginis]
MRKDDVVDLTASGAHCASLFSECVYKKSATCSSRAPALPPLPPSLPRHRPAPLSVHDAAPAANLSVSVPIGCENFRRPAPAQCQYSQFEITITLCSLCVCLLTVIIRVGFKLVHRYPY